MIESMQANWQQWGTAVAVTVAVAVFLRMAKKQKWAQKLQMAGINCGKAFSIMLLHWLPPVAAEKAEEGIFVTGLDLLKSFLDGFEIGILADNAKMLRKKKED